MHYSKFGECLREIVTLLVFYIVAFVQKCYLNFNDNTVGFMMSESSIAENAAIKKQSLLERPVCPHTSEESGRPLSLFSVPQNVFNII